LELKPIENTLIVLAGPTASGKSAIAVHIAKHFHTEIISADSRQFYKELPIGTAAPTAEMLNEVKHYFVGNLSLTDVYNASKFEKDVLQLLETSFLKRPVIVLTGGSGLYIDVVCNGIDEIPDTEIHIRKKVQHIFETSGIEGLQNKLHEIDPEYFEFVDSKNPVRLMRAIEVFLQTGEKYSALRQNEKKQRNFRIIKIALELPRGILYERINKRTDEMIALGWIDEAKAVFPLRHLNALNTVGYKELFKFIGGEWPLEFAVEKIKTNTRRYAKRQMTWFKKNDDYFWFSPENKEAIIMYIQNELCS
jgi:tRNA dimethylallyltransferase